MGEFFEQKNISVFQLLQVPSFGEWFLDSITVNEGKLSAVEVFPPEVVDLFEAFDRVRNLTCFVEKLLTFPNIVISERLYVLFSC